MKAKSMPLAMKSKKENPNQPSLTQPFPPQFMQYPYIAFASQIPYVQPYAALTYFPQTLTISAPPQMPQPINQSLYQNLNLRRGHNDQERRLV